MKLSVLRSGSRMFFFFFSKEICRPTQPRQMSLIGSAEKIQSRFPRKSVQAGLGHTIRYTIVLPIIITQKFSSNLREFAKLCKLLISVNISNEVVCAQQQFSYVFFFCNFQGNLQTNLTKADVLDSDIQSRLPRKFADAKPKNNESVEHYIPVYLI